MMSVDIDFVGNEPKRMSKDAAGYDLAADKEYYIEPGFTVMVNTNTAVSIPDGYFGMCAPRSSICNKKGLVLANSVGIIDSDFIGSIKFAYRNPTRDPIFIDEGERIGQLVIVPYVAVNYIKVDKLEMTERGTGGFGSTGIK